MVLLGTLFGLVVLVVAMKATVTITSQNDTAIDGVALTDDPEEPTPQAIDKLCCFTRKLTARDAYC